MDFYKNIDWSILASYLSGECLRKKPIIDKWLESDPEHQRLFQVMKTAWDVEEAQLPISNLDKMWREIEKKSDFSIANYDNKNRHIKINNRFITYWLKPSPLIRIAAILILVVGLSLIIGKITDIFPLADQIQYQMVTVPKGAHSELTLADGTEIIMDAGTTFKYPLKFADAERTVYLDGEAYFEVAHDNDKPFVVLSHNAKIRVLGTKFNIRGWGQTGNVGVVVTEGTVSLQSTDFSGGDSVIISEGQLSILRQNESPTSPRSVDVSRYLGWMRNDIIFDNAPVYEVLDQLDRWYDIRISLPDSSIGWERISVHIKKKSLKDILDLLAALTGLSYEQKGKQVCFQK